MVLNKLYSGHMIFSVVKAVVTAVFITSAVFAMMLIAMYFLVYFSAMAGVFR